MGYQTSHSRILRKVRRLAEAQNGHRLVRFRLSKGTEDSQLGREWFAWCRRCNATVCVFPEFALPDRFHARVSVCQCGHPERRSTYVVHAD